MELQRFALILWHRVSWILLGIVLAAGGAYLVSTLSYPVYAASVTILVNQASSDQVTDYTALLTSERLARTYAELLTKRPVLEEAIATFKVSVSSEDMARKITVRFVRDTQLIQLQVEDEDPALAAKLANAIPDIFRRQNDLLQASRYTSTRESLLEELDSLNRQLQLTQVELNAIGTPRTAAQQTRAARLQSELTQLRESYTSLLRSYENIRLAEAQSTNNILVVEPAKVPDTPIRPLILQNTLLAAVIGLLVAVGLVFLREYVDDTIRTPEQVSEVIGLPVVGTIARINANSARDTLAPFAAREPRSPVTEAYRALRTSIQFAGIDQPIRTLLVTSPSPGEGKTTTAVNLAVVMAQAGLRVLLIDCDLRRPAIHKMFERSNQVGLTDAMLQESSRWSGVPHPTSVNSLMILTSGSLPPNPSELLGSERMARFLNSFRSSFDVLILDGPPLLAVTDASILSRLTDGVLIVVETGKTRLGAASHAKEQLSQTGARLLGVIMNKIVTNQSGYYYYRYYPYYDTYGDESRKRFWGLPLVMTDRRKGPRAPANPPEDAIEAEKEAPSLESASKP